MPGVSTARAASRYFLCTCALSLCSSGHSTRQASTRPSRKSSPRFYGFIVVVIFYWSRMWDHIWNPVNQGKLYAHSPYVYPPAGDGE